MSDFAPPSGPPPPKVPQGWKAVWNEQYSEWFYVNLRTKKSQWDKPTEPDYRDEEAPPAGPPPSYTPSKSPLPSGDAKRLNSNNPYSSGAAGGPPPDVSEDEAMARRLQEEENARARGRSSQEINRGAADSYYSQAPTQGSHGSGYPTQSQGYGGSLYPAQNEIYGAASPQPQGSGKKGFLSKLMGGSSSMRPSQQSYPPQQAGYGYGQPQYGPPGGGYYAQPGYATAPAAAQKKHGGMGMLGAGGLGLGAGLLGGALIGEAADAGDHGNTYIENNDYGDDGGDFGGDGGGDFGGGDF